MGGLRYTMDLEAGHTAQCGPAAVESCHAEVSMIAWYTCTCVVMCHVSFVCIVCIAQVIRRGDYEMVWDATDCTGEGGR